eukprot:COSAG02_NODE_58536_length_277_cov_0.578652_1_plen_38_part_01
MDAKGRRFGGFRGAESTQDLQHFTCFLQWSAVNKRWSW